MINYVKPKLVVSHCLEFEKLRYDGQYVPCETVRELRGFVNFVKVCPEYEIGLGVPREPIRIVRKGGEDRLVQPKTGRDVTGEMDEFTEKFLDDLPQLDGFLFKSKSPTVGLNRIKKYSDETGPNVVEKGAGFFARKIIDRYEGYPMEDNDRLRNGKIRTHFFTKLFTFSDFRSSVRSGKYVDLKRFHEKNRLLFKLHNPDVLDSMDYKLEETKAMEEIIDDYFDLMKEAFSRGFVSKNFEKLGGFLLDRYVDDISEEEIQHIEEILDIYKENKIGSITLLIVFKNLASRFKDKFILRQTVFEPFPRVLSPEFDEDRDRNFWKND